MICIFNPEHDLCLANGSPHYMPPESARRFAQQGALLMKILYPDAQDCISVANIPHYFGSHSATIASRIIPWGWNAVLKEHLLSQGISESLLPSDKELEGLRNLQHRSTLLPLQPDSRAVTSPLEVKDLLLQHRNLVLKAPWSGSGRGLRWVSTGMTDHDLRWFEKIVRTQQCVLAQPRLCVAEEFAVEYMVRSNRLELMGFSLFVSSNGVYKANLLLPDEAIRQRVRFSLAEQEVLESWLRANVVGQYHGPLGVDYIHTPDGHNHLSELNFRHTMGMVAHQLLLRNPALQGLWRTIAQFFQ